MNPQEEILDLKKVALQAAINISFNVAQSSNSSLGDNLKGNPHTAKDIIKNAKVFYNFLTKK